MRCSHLMMGGLFALASAILVGQAQAQSMTSPSTMDQTMTPPGSTTGTTDQTMTAPGSTTGTTDQRMTAPGSSSTTTVDQQSTYSTGAVDTSRFTSTATAPAATSLVSLRDQYIPDGTVDILQLRMPETGFVAIYENVEGRRGDLLGYKQFNQGMYENVQVPISRLPKNNSAFAVVHTIRQRRATNIASRFDPQTYPVAQSPLSAIASFNVYPYATGYVNVEPGRYSSTSSYSSTTTTTGLPSGTTTPGTTLPSPPGQTIVPSSPSTPPASTTEPVTPGQRP